MENNYQLIAIYNLIFNQLGFSYFLRLLGPAGGYALASFCLKIYISPDLTPTIDNKGELIP